MSVTKIACGARFSAIAVATFSGSEQGQYQHEELWVLGDTASHCKTATSILKIALPNSGLKDMRCSND